MLKEIDIIIIDLNKSSCEIKSIIFDEDIISRDELRKATREYCEEHINFENVYICFLDELEKLNSSWFDNRSSWDESRNLYTPRNIWIDRLCFI